MARKKKDRIHLYFQEYLTIKNDLNLSPEQRIDQLETLRDKAIEQMILEKLDITDFNIFSQALETERLMLMQSSSESES